MHWLIFIMVMVRAQYAPYWISAGSMSPTLVPGDYMLARYAAPDRLSRGDIVVFRHPVNGVHFVKRVVGLSGDTVQMRGGKVVLNGAALPQVPDGNYVVSYAPQGPAGHYPRCANGPVGEGGDCIAERFIETLPDGRSWQVLNIDDEGYADSTDLFTVPTGHIFVLGDNRDNSVDSRFDQANGGIGFVPLSNIFAIPEFVIVSTAGSSFLEIWAWRPSRFFPAVR
ncbi:MAG: signal peptidase I [Gemmobacter sp.]